MRMQIWLPEPLYRLFPLMSISLGGLFGFTAPGVLSLILSIGLVAYGVLVLADRAIN